MRSNDNALHINFKQRCSYALLLTPKKSRRGSFHAYLGVNKGSQNKTPIAPLANNDEMDVNPGAEKEVVSGVGIKLVERWNYPFPRLLIVLCKSTHAHIFLMRT
eukprot:GHVO01060211.1.p2 GENE.GHVO01060211.1~~GHVO01060211.1.p2  ORF type:complete len:104 (+),score=4.01 GHVO01060211.1:635-946(+)